MEDDKKVPIQIDAEKMKKLEASARARGISVEEVIDIAIGQYMKNLQKERGPTN